MRGTPPDILITNYKMLDLLLQRAEDLPLWEDADLAYVVLDEFHTYDGAQGTDVAMLLRRLAAAHRASHGRAAAGRRSARSRPRRRSARAAQRRRRAAIREVAEQVFGAAVRATTPLWARSATGSTSSCPRSTSRSTRPTRSSLARPIPAAPSRRARERPATPTHGPSGRTPPIVPDAPAPSPYLNGPG